MLKEMERLERWLNHEVPLLRHGDLNLWQKSGMVLRAYKLSAWYTGTGKYMKQLTGLPVGPF